MELAYRPTPYLELNAGLGAMRSRIRKFAENPQYVGNESPKVPERELTFGIQGFLPLGRGHSPGGARRLPARGRDGVARGQCGHA